MFGFHPAATLLTASANSRIHPRCSASEARPADESLPARQCKQGRPGESLDLRCSSASNHAHEQSSIAPANLRQPMVSDLGALPYLEATSHLTATYARMGPNVPHVSRSRARTHRSLHRRLMCRRSGSAGQRRSSDRRCRPVDLRLSRQSRNSFFVNFVCQELNLLSKLSLCCEKYWHM